MENLIFDRTQNDLINNTEKAYYNYTDLNRIEAWCEFLSEALNEYNYKNNIIVKKDWNMSDFPTYSEMERIRSNVNTLKTAYSSFTSVPENLDYMTIEKANAIEKILYEIDTLIKNMISSFIYCDEVYAGEV